MLTKILVRKFKVNFVMFVSVNVAVQIGERASYSDVTRISSMLPGKRKKLVRVGYWTSLFLILKMC